MCRTACALDFIYYVVQLPVRLNLTLFALTEAHIRFESPASFAANDRLLNFCLSQEFFIKFGSKGALKSFRGSFELVLHYIFWCEVKIGKKMSNFLGYFAWYDLLLFFSLFWLTGIVGLFWLLMFFGKFLLANLSILGMAIAAEYLAGVHYTIILRDWICFWLHMIISW